MLSYHKKTGLQVIESPPIPAAKVGTYLGEKRFDRVTWKLRVQRKPKGSTWMQLTVKELPAKLKTEALLLGVRI